MYNFSQEQIFIFFFIIGIIIALIFDIFKVLRKSFKTSDFATFIEDIAFLIISGTFITTSIIKLNKGEIRFFLFLGIFFGVLLYSLTISNLCVIILYTFVETCKKILKIPIYCFKNVFKNLKALIKKDF